MRSRNDELFTYLVPKVQPKSVELWGGLIHEMNPFSIDGGQLGLWIGWVYYFKNKRIGSRGYGLVWYP